MMDEGSPNRSLIYFPIVYTETDMGSLAATADKAAET